MLLAASPCLVAGGVEPKSAVLGEPLWMVAAVDELGPGGAGGSVDEADGEGSIAPARSWAWSMANSPTSSGGGGRPILGNYERDLAPVASPRPVHSGDSRAGVSHWLGRIWVRQPCGEVRFRGTTSGCAVGDPPCGFRDSCGWSSWTDGRSGHGKSPLGQLPNGSPRRFSTGSGQSRGPTWRPRPGFGRRACA